MVNKWLTRGRKGKMSQSIPKEGKEVSKIEDDKRQPMMARLEAR